MAAKAVGGMRFHDLRHAYATWLVTDGVPINLVQLRQLCCLLLPLDEETPAESARYEDEEGL